MTIAEALREAARRLAATSDTARLDAELLMAHMLGVTRSELLVRHMAGHEPAGFAGLIQRRIRHEPVAYITGRQEFYGLELEVNPSVLIPRADSETLIEAARNAFEHRDPPRRILDLGTGSGALLLAALVIWPEAEGIGIDRDAEAIATALRNAERTRSVADGTGTTGKLATGSKSRALFHCLDWTIEGWREDLGRFDLVLTNPPYVENDAELAPSVREFEPAGALFAGLQGLDAYRLLLPQLPSLLEPEGIAVVEIGSRQARSVHQIAENAQLRAETVQDLAGRDRALVLARRKSTGAD